MCHFVYQNDAFAYGVIIENFGNGKFEMNSTCFVGNKSHGNGLVASYSAELPPLANNFGADNEVEFGDPLECEFVALVDANDPYPNLECADFDADTCAIVLEDPTPAPVETPAPAMPTTVPTTDSGAATPPTAVSTSTASVVRLLPGIMAATVALIAVMA